jgi:hypothetical protein
MPLWVTEGVPIVKIATTTVLHVAVAVAETLQAEGVPLYFASGVGAFLFIAWYNNNPVPIGSGAGNTKATVTLFYELHHLALQLAL